MKSLRLTVAVRLKLAFLILPLSLIFLISLYFGFNLTRNENQIKQSTATRVARGVMEKTDRNFYERFGDVQAFAANILAQETARNPDTLKNQTQKFMDTMTSYYVLYDLMMITDKTGKVLICNTVDKDGRKIDTEFLKGTSVADQEWFRACAAGSGPEAGAWYSDLTVDEAVARIYHSRGLGMAFAAPIRDENGATIGVWYNFASWKEVTQGIRKEALLALRQTYPQAEIVLVNQAGTVIDASHEDLILHEQLALENTPEGEVMTFNGYEQLSFEDFLGGMALSSGAYTFKGKQWQCITLIPRSHFTLLSGFSWELLGICLVMLTISFFLSRYFADRLSQRIATLKARIHHLSLGEITHTQQLLGGQDELTDMEAAILQLNDGLQRTSHFASEVGQGNFEADFTPLSEQDTLGNALLRMRDNLRKSAEEDRKRNWTTEGLALFANILRAQDNIGQLSDNLIRHLVKYLGANQGGIFIARTDEDGSTCLELTACYAYERKKYLEKKVLAGQGLLGQAFLEKDTIYITQTPEHYMRITSGLGNGRPRCLLIVPLKLNDTVQGVLELASFQPFEAHERAFVEKLAESIASTLVSAHMNEQTQQLLTEARMREEEMRAQEEEMRQNMEELSATQEEMRRKENDYIQLIEQLQQRENHPKA